MSLLLLFAQSAAGPTPQYVASSSFSGSATAGTVNVTIPADVPLGSALVMSVAWKAGTGTGTINTPSGWTAVLGPTAGTGATYQGAVFMREATTGVPGSTVTVAASSLQQQINVAGCAFSGAAVTARNAAWASNGTTDSTTVDTAAATVETADRVLVVGAVRQSTSGPAGTPTFTGPPGGQIRAQSANTSGSSQNVACFVGDSNTDTSGSRAVTASTSCWSLAGQIVLQPVGGPQDLSAEAALSAASTLDAAGTRLTPGAAALSAASSLSAAAIQTTPATAGLSGASGLSSSGATLSTPAAAALGAASGMGSAATSTAGAVGALTAATSLSAAGVQVGAAGAALTAGTDLAGGGGGASAGAAALTVATALAGSGVYQALALAELTAASNLAATAALVRLAAAGMTAASGLTAAGVGVPAGAAALQANTDLQTSSLTRLVAGQAVLAAVTAISAGPQHLQSISALLSATATLTADADTEGLPPVAAAHRITIRRPLGVVVRT